MKKIYNFLFIYLTIIYLVFSYFLFPYVSSIINPTNIFYVDNEYIFVVFFSIFIFCLIFLILKKFVPIKNYNIHEDYYVDEFSLITLAYLLFISGLFSKIVNILNGSYLDYFYSDVNSNFFIYEYFSSINILSLLSFIFFIANFYNNKKSYNFFYYLIPILYFIFFLIFSPGGRINLIIILLFIFIFEFFKFSNIRLFVFKLISILITFIFLFNLATFKRDATLLNYIGIHVMNLDKEIYFSDKNFRNKKLINILFDERLILFKCKKNIMEYEDKSKYSKYDICKLNSFHDSNIDRKQITTNLKIKNSDEFKKVTFNNNLQMGILSNSIYNITVRLNNYMPLNSILYLVKNNEFNDRSIFNEFKIITFSYLNSFLKYFNFRLNYERNLEVDNFNIKSGITNPSYETGVSPTLIGDIYWIGGYIFLFLYFIKISLTIYFLNYIFNSKDLFLKTISFFFFIHYLSTFEQSFEAHSIIFLKNITILSLCTFCYYLIKKINFKFLRKNKSKWFI